MQPWVFNEHVPHVSLNHNRFIAAELLIDSFEVIPEDRRTEY
jgi:hypothetical protein